MINLAEYNGALYQVYKANNGWLKLKPIQVQTLKKKAKNELLAQFTKEELMDAFLKAEDTRREKAIIERCEDEQFEIKGKDY